MQPLHVLLHSTKFVPENVEIPMNSEEPMAAQIIRNEGNVFFKERDFRNAYGLYTQSLQNHGIGWRAWSNRSLCNEKLGYPAKQSIADARMACFCGPKQAKCWARLGAAMARRGDEEVDFLIQAVEYIKVAVELDPGNPSFKKILTDLEKRLESDKREPFDAEKMTDQRCMSQNLLKAMKFASASSKAAEGDPLNEMGGIDLGLKISEAQEDRLDLSSQLSNSLKQARMSLSVIKELQQAEHIKWQLLLYYSKQETGFSYVTKLKDFMVVIFERDGLSPINFATIPLTAEFLLLALYSTMQFPGIHDMGMDVDFPQDVVNGVLSERGVDTSGGEGFGRRDMLGTNRIPLRPKCIYICHQFKQHFPFLRMALERIGVKAVLSQKQEEEVLAEKLRLLTNTRAHIEAEEKTPKAVNAVTSRAMKKRAKAQGCRVCGTVEQELRTCQACLRVYYCGKECQKSDWKNHKAHCRKVSKNKAKKNLKIDK